MDAVETATCPVCQGTIRNRALFCRRCGTDAAGGPWRWTRPLLSLGFAAFLAAAFGLGAFFPADAPGFAVAIGALSALGLGFTLLAGPILLGSPHDGAPDDIRHRARQALEATRRGGPAGLLSSFFKTSREPRAD